jgi:hypothetical protein
MNKPSSRTAPAHEMRPSGNTTADARAKEVAGWKARLPLKGEAGPPGNNLWQRPVYDPARDNR